MIPADPVADPVAVPAGDPAALRAAASTLSASAETLDGAATTVERAVATAVPSAWAGTAARSCASAEERAVADCRALVRAVREAAAAVAQLAAELSEAIDDARRAAGQAADVSAAILRADRTAAAAGPSELPALRRHAHQLATEATRARLHGEAATERARLANLAAAAAFDQITASLPQAATLAADCTTETRTALDRQLATFPESVFSLGMLLTTGGAVIDAARKKDKGKGGGRAGGTAGGGGGPSTGKPPQDRDQRQRIMPGAIWTKEEAARKAREMGFVNTPYRPENEPVYKKGRRYISRDRTGHHGEAWKMGYDPWGLSRPETRLGTYNKDLTQRVRD